MLRLLSTLLSLTSTIHAFTCSLSSAQDPTTDAACSTTCQNYVFNAAGSASEIPALSDTPSGDEKDVDCASGHACVMLSAIYFICLDTATWDWTDGYGGTGNIKSGAYQFSDGSNTKFPVMTSTQAAITMADNGAIVTSSSMGAGAAGGNGDGVRGGFGVGLAMMIVGMLELFL